MATDRELELLEDVARVEAYEDQLRDEKDDEITQLKAALAKFGGHTTKCAVWVQICEHRRMVIDASLGRKCDCGWAEIAKGMK